MMNEYPIPYPTVALASQEACSNLGHTGETPCPNIPLPHHQDPASPAALNSVLSDQSSIVLLSHMQMWISTPTPTPELHLHSREA